ncbi:response regulator transcription factor [Fervidibacillus halotolerans]|uniref:Response regulator transcription factor n=1 Tax=Fervidibacillus halotolerans TaxID=2980027 RepID=A0A9E8RZ59_9BACI|nr:response regulator transcription factor [Fervidibacillus halotolerans]WAA12978.1 response regulator transcription factor [Fervidibacillus halotolerans]
MERTIAIIDDEEQIRKMIKQFLENEGFQTIEGKDGDEGVRFIQNKEVDLVLLDVMMPNMNGFEVLKEIRKLNERLPVIMLTAKTEEIDKLLGLEMGADDYITKPFSLRELAARIKAVLRRSEPGSGEEQDEIWERGNIMINLSTYEVKKDGKLLSLTPTEFKLLTALAEKPGRVFSRLQLMMKVMGEAYANYERSIDTHVSNLRKKIEKNPAEPEYIQTVYGIGYKFGEKR